MSIHSLAEKKFGLAQRREELLDLLRQTSGQGDGGRPSPEAVAALRSSGLLGLAVPVEHGGMGGDALSVNRLVAEVSRVAPSIGIILFQHFAVTMRITEWGTEEQRRRHLPPMASGEVLAASAWSEKDAGADKRDISTTAVPAPGCSGWVVNGAKSFTTGAGIADLYLVLAKTSEPARDEAAAYGGAGQSFFLIDADRPGVEDRAWTGLEGMQESATGSVGFHDCFIDDEAMLGREGDASRIIASVRESGATLGAVSVGIADAVYELVRDHAGAGGRCAERAVRHRLVDLKVKVETARAVVEQAGRREAEDIGATTLFSKLFASDACEEICHEAVRLLGSAGYAQRHPINRLTRDARAIALMGPTNDLCRELASERWAA